MGRISTGALLLLALSTAPAAALDQASMPAKFPIPWGASAGTAYIRSIPAPSQIGIQNCAASLTDGFPPLTFVPASAGGCPPFGQDMNGILRQLSQWNRWGQAGGPVYYDSAFSAAIGGYPKGAVLQSSYVPGNRWLSTIDNNLANPDTATGGEWVQDPSQVQTGTPMPSLSATAPQGSVLANGETIGSSTGTALQGLQTFALYRFVWANCPNTRCAILTSGGTPTTRGASADADFAANKGLTLPSMKGLGLMGADTMGGTSTTFLAGVPVASGSTTTPNSILGENLHSLVGAENGTHAHANTLTDPGHIHPSTLTDPGHLHVADIADPGHIHTTTMHDPGHTHPTLITQAQFAISSGSVGPFLFGATIGGGVPSNTIGTTVTNVTVDVNNHATGVTASTRSAQTGLSINNAGIGTGVSINNANSGSGTGHNTVQRGMVVYWVLKL